MGISTVQNKLWNPRAACFSCSSGFFGSSGGFADPTRQTE